MTTTLTTLTTPTAPPIQLPPAARVEPPASPVARAREWVADVAVLTYRNVLHIRREPMQLSDATVQPVLFTLLFVYIFGSAMAIAGGGAYKMFAIGGLVTMNLTTASMGTAVGMSSDVSTGMMNRFRTLPMSRSAILAGRTISDLFAAALCGTIVLLTGLAIGWRPDHGIVGVLEGMAVALLFAYALSWFTACIGLAVGDPESAQGIGMVILFPLAFLSTCFVPAAGLPTVPRIIAEWNPVSAVAGSCRELFGNPNPAALSDVWPAQHPVLMAIGSSLVILAICVPLASRLLRNATTD